MVDGATLERLCGRKSTGGSNPPPSAKTSLMRGFRFFGIILAMKNLLAFTLLALSLVGCKSYVLVQTNIFADDDGNVVRVDYGRSESPHTNTFVNPANGKKMEFMTTLVVEVVLPDGDDITAWQCMNFMPSGTMYKTDNEKWMVLVNGFTIMIYQRAEDKSHYIEVYRGVLCESPKSTYEPNKKWRTLKKNANGKWK